MEKKKIDKVKKQEPKKYNQPFRKENYKIMFIGLGVLCVGYLLLIGGGSDDPRVFSYKIFDFQRLILAPILIMSGYMIEIFAIMKKPSPVNNEQ